MRPHLLAAVIAATPVATSAEMARYEIDPDHAVVAFLVDHVGYARVLGRFTDISGHFMYDAANRELGTVEVTIGAASVDTDHEARDGHVRGSDFLDVEAHPSMTFTAEGGTATGENTGTVTGDLTLLGQSRPLTLDVTLNKVAPYPFGHRKETVGVSARGSVTRSAYGMDYAVANGLVGDEVQLIIEVEALRAD